MSNLEIDYPNGATHLDPDEMAGLIPNYITSQGELNILEKENIIEATRWALRKRTHDCLNVSFCLDLHKRMFKKVWKWAGTQRQTNKNIGVDKIHIPMKLKELFDDVKYWIDNDTFNNDEICVRFHHRLVAIHAFPNGNGRHARLMTEVLQTFLEEPLFSWGANPGSYNSDLEIREAYIKALKEADQGNYQLLFDFVRK